MTGSRRGTSLLETLVAMALGMFILHLGLTTLARLRQFGDRAAIVHDEILGARIGRSVLRQELRRGVPGRDRWPDTDSIALRAFRGTGLVCAVDTAAAALTVSYSGDRLPDPRKDSLEWVGAGGSVGAADLVASESLAGGCSSGFSGARTMLLRTEGPWPPHIVAIRIFERGSYHLAESALRYRTGLGGRQPISPEAWDDRGSQFRGRGASVGYTLAPASRSASWSDFLAWEHR